LFFLLYTNELPKTISNVSKRVLFAENTSIIATNHIAAEIKNDINTVLGNIKDWFRINLLPLNFQRTYYLQFVTKYSYKINMNICYENKQIINTYSTKFLRLLIDHSLSWNNHID
jgi:RNA processing factor Prp31